ncbi:MAG: hypothetical protein AUK47_13665 [Deltaproteobacteria bacterium CG2_30_63_29]|nr:MAG: hypothetical protein AUK47_13665 [Deltaproteobacteria bacterium CG2_30_63_29]PJB48342.1 MAG: hypothetical protein CO108_02505 [Deltaproteobacteria bacterium CG_4_9_14_3_um_filter_63_12]
MRTAPLVLIGLFGLLGLPGGCERREQPSLGTDKNEEQLLLLQSQVDQLEQSLEEMAQKNARLGASLEALEKLLASKEAGCPPCAPCPAGANVEPERERQPPQQ